MELLRGAGELRGSLDAEVALYCDERLADQLERLGDELRFVLITSEARVESIATAPGEAATTDVDGLRVLASASKAPKCERCWHRREDVGRYEAHPTLCGRCVENVTGAGEVRRFA